MLRLRLARAVVGPRAALGGKRAEAGSTRCCAALRACRAALETCRAALQRGVPRCNVVLRCNVWCCQAFCTLGPASEAASLIAADVAALKAAAAKVGEHTLLQRRTIAQRTACNDATMRQTTCVRRAT